MLRKRMLGYSLLYLLATLPCVFAEVGYEVIVEHRTIQYELRFMAIMAITFLVLPIVIVLLRPIFQRINESEAKIRGLNSDERDY